MAFVSAPISLLLALPAGAVAVEAAALPPLKVSVKPSFEPELLGRPGRSLIDIEAPTYSKVRVTVRAHGKTVLFDEPENSGGPLVENEYGEMEIGPTGVFASVVFWSCKQPGTVYSYVVTAEETGAAPLTQTGSFGGISRRQCEQVRRIAARVHAEGERRQQAADRRQLAEELARRRRFEANCHTVGGKPVIINTARGRVLVCRSQTGGIVQV